MTSRTAKICKEVAELYSQLDSKLNALQCSCSGCGSCCDFDSYGHRLFLTTPELLYFTQNVRLQPMNGGSCPYMDCGRCTVRNFRFAGCRIFFCKQPESAMNQLYENMQAELQQICSKYNLNYCYMDLKTALQAKDFQYFKPE